MLTGAIIKILLSDNQMKKETRERDGKDFIYLEIKKCIILFVIHTKPSFLERPYLVSSVANLLLKSSGLWIIFSSCCHLPFLSTAVFL